MTDSPAGGPLHRSVVQTPVSSAMTSPNLASDDVPRTLAAYGEGHPLPPMETEADRDAFEAAQRRGWQDRS